MIVTHDFFNCNTETKKIIKKIPEKDTALQYAEFLERLIECKKINPIRTIGYSNHLRAAVL
jgi:hypothetical protein